MLQAFVLNVLVGGVAACGFFGTCVVASAPSQMPDKRRLKYDSNALVGRALFVLGAMIGLVIASIAAIKQMDIAGAWFMTAILSLVAGIFAPLPLVKSLANGYLVRAKANFAAGAFREAYEDATEAYRSLHAFGPKQEAAHIRDAAHTQRQATMFSETEELTTF
jgi:MFS family permease